jgi:hypothetical protein
MIIKIYDIDDFKNIVYVLSKSGYELKTKYQKRKYYTDDSWYEIEILEDAK